ncbi:hypothetical protein [Thermophilibacter provencensis]|uniref:DUF6788 domain-containing protein n=1 Tax=Thermophilibacter provencensis TaxID=1852386 RepID=A0ABT7V0S5_9ACTN|nr:hypothetical protein [Thermophilibacter provencensis]MDM8270210.1 hypothetical protein [Thermophilibacter provencensis]
MSVLEDVLREEYARSLRLGHLMEKELASLPKGSVRVRMIRGREYYYLNHREGDRVLSDYIPASEVEVVRTMVARRKELKAALKEQERSRKQIERALGGRPDVDVREESAAGDSTAHFGCFQISEMKKHVSNFEARFEAEHGIGETFDNVEQFMTSLDD